jgi:hypothetical protein
MEVSGELHALAALLPVKDLLVPIGVEAGWAREPVWTLWRRKQSCPCRESNPGLPARNVSLYRLSYRIMFSNYSQNLYSALGGFSTIINLISTTLSLHNNKTSFRLPQVCILQESLQYRGLLQTGYRAVGQQRAALATTANSRVEGDRSPAPSPGRNVRRRTEGGSNLFDKMNER